MITLDQIERRGYKIAFGDRAFIERQPNQQLEVDLLHAHSNQVDGLDSVQRMLEVAVEFVDNVTVSDHDSNQANLEFGDLIRAHGMRPRQGFEYTAYRRNPNGVINQVHILAHHPDVNAARELVVPDEIMPPEEFNSFMHDQGAVVTAAHPTFEDESLTREEIERAQASNDPSRRFDFLEFVNYGVSQAEHGIRLAGPVGMVMRKLGRWPQLGAMTEARAIFEDHQRDPRKNAMGASAGSDSHRAVDVTGVLVGHPVGTNVFDASREGELVILQRRPKLYTAGQYSEFKRRDHAVDAQWRERFAAQEARPPVLAR